MTEIQTVTVETTMAPEVIEVYSGPRGEQGPIWHTGAFPPSEEIGQTNDLYLVSEGATNEGNVYKKSSDGTWVPSGNIRGATGGIQSINGKTGSSVIISAADITTGVIGMSQLPTGTTAGTVALGNHNHDSVYEGIIPAGTTSQYLRGDKTWQPLSAAAVGLGNVDNTSDLLKPISTATQTALNNKTDKVWSATGIKVYRDVVQQYFAGQTLPQYFKIKTNIPIDSTIMMKMRVKVYAYNRGVVDGWFSGYAYNSNGGQILGPRWLNTGNVPVTVTAHADSNNKLVLVLDGNFPYARVSVDEVESGFGSYTNESYFQNWTIENSDNIDELASAYPMVDHFNYIELINSKQNAIPLGTTSQFYRGDKTWQAITKSNVGLGNVDNTSDLAKPISTATANALAGKVSTSGNEAIGGTKTFSSAPVVPDNSFTIAKVNGLQAALDAKATADSSMLGVTNPVALAKFHSARGMGSVKVVVVGDSISDGTGSNSFANTFTQKLQKFLREGQTGTPGYIRPVTQALHGLPVTYSGTEVFGGWGLGGNALTLSDPAHHATYSAVNCTKVRVWYGKTDFLHGGLKVAIDDVDQVTLSSADPSGNSDGYYWDSPTLTAGSHTVKITAAATDFVGILDGVEFFDSTQPGDGIRVYNGAHFGFHTGTFTSTNMEMHWQVVNAINPDLVIINLGSNDVAMNYTATQYKNNILAMIAKLPATTPVLLLAPWKRGDPPNDSMTTRNAYAAALESIATGRVAFADLQPHWPVLQSDGSTSAGLMFESPNPIHPSTGGHDYYARIVNKYLN